MRYNLRPTASMFPTYQEAHDAAALIKSEHEEIIIAAWTNDEGEKVEFCSGVVCYDNIPKPVIIQKAHARLVVDSQHDVKEYHRPTSKGAELARERVALEQEVAALKAELAAKQA